MKVKLTQEQIDTLSYDDVAYLILESHGKKITIQNLFKEVLKAMNLPESEFEAGIGDFFELILTDKRFIMLEKGCCDLKINHSTKIIIEDDDEEIEITEEPEDKELSDEDEEEVNYDDEDTVDDENEDELEDLVIIDEKDEETEML